MQRSEDEDKVGTQVTRVTFSTMVTATAHLLEQQYILTSTDFYHLQKFYNVMKNCNNLFRDLKYTGVTGLTVCRLDAPQHNFHAGIAFTQKIQVTRILAP